MDGKLLVSISSAAERLGIGRTLTYQLVLSGAIKSVTIGRCRRVPVQALEAFVQERLAEADQRTDQRTDQKTELLRGKSNGSNH